MSVSLHLASFPPRRAGRMLRSMPRHHEALLADPAVTIARFYMLAEFDPIVGGTPTPLRWGLLIGWADRDARDERLGEGMALAPFLDGARESLSLALDTVKVRAGDTLNGWRPASEGVASARADEPVVVMTHGRFRPRYLPAFHWNNRKIARSLHGDPALVMSVGALDDPLTRATFSLWRARQPMTDFSYRADPHNAIRRRSLDVGWGGQFFFARFRPTASSGTWAGRDPLAEATSGAR